MASPSRLAWTRRALTGVGVPLVAALAGLPAPLAADATRKKRRKKCKPRPAPACAELCADGLCYVRAEGRPFCGYTPSAPGCLPCETDADCFGTPNLPYCLLGTRDRDTNEFRDFTACPNQIVGICATAPIP